MYGHPTTGPSGLEMNATQVVSPVRDSTIRSGMERLEKLISESDEIVDRLRSVFSPVLFHGDVPSPASAVRPVAPGSDLGQAISRLSDRLDDNLSAIRRVLNASDV